MKILVYKDIESKFLLFYLLKEVYVTSICNLVPPCSGSPPFSLAYVGFKSC